MKEVASESREEELLTTEEDIDQQEDLWLLKKSSKYVVQPLSSSQDRPALLIDPIIFMSREKQAELLGRLLFLKRQVCFSMEAHI